MHAVFNYIALPVVIIYQFFSYFTLLFVSRLFRDKKDIKGQRILITGAGSGIGRQLAIEFSKHATCLVLVDINRNSLLETEKLLDSKSTVFLHACDVSDYENVYEMAKNVKNEAGEVDILVNNAGIVSGRYLMDLPEEKIVNTMKVNTLAHFWTCKAFLPAMMKKNHGHIVAISSLAGQMGGPCLTDYSASKFAVLGFAEALGMELGEQKLDGIKVTIVCPSFTDTGLFPGIKITVASVLTPEYVAKEIVLGVLEDEDVIILPRHLKYLVLVKNLLPHSFFVKCLEMTGDLKMMQKFAHRQENGVHLTEKLKENS